jgi:uncharacterized protein YndB with AHSA1/START domain
MGRSKTLCYEVDVQATADRVWQALVDPDITQQYYFHTRVESDWKVGSSISYRDPKGRPAVEGKIVEFAPPTRLVTTFEAKWLPGDVPDPTSTVVWEVSSQGATSKLKLTHQDLSPAHPAAGDIEAAWQPTLDSLKSVVEKAN